MKIQMLTLPSMSTDLGENFLLFELQLPFPKQNEAEGEIFYGLVSFKTV